ncbi:MAG: hypothetical protein Q7U84_10060 [Polynucleobacter sp.]|nr:hypothetical protein [Polynucleobacter sp.]
MQSVIEILMVAVKEGTSKKTGQAFKISEAHCVLRNDDNTVGAVGVLTVPRSLEAIAVPGLYTGKFAMEASTFGQDAGRIVVRLVGLTPIKSSQLSRSPVAA